MNNLPILSFEIALFYDKLMCANNHLSNTFLDLIGYDLFVGKYSFFNSSFSVYCT